MTRCSSVSLSSVSVIEDVEMLDTNPLLSGLEIQGVTMQDPDIPHSELHSMPGTSNNINMQQSVFPELPLNQAFTPGIWGEEKIKKCRCQVCVQAGRDGKTCKGKNNHKNCEFIEVCSFNYLYI